MSESTLNRHSFIDLLHEIFMMKKGHGAYAYISVSDALSLFNDYLESGQSAKSFISQFVRSK